jgi:O-antigen ligase
MDKTNSYPDIFQQVHYGLQKQTPSYQSEFPNDLPFDPGATSTLFELNYFPTTGSRLLLFIPVLLVLLLIYFRKYIRKDIGQVGFLLSMILVFFGPLRLPSFVPFNTTLGLVKAMGLLLSLYIGIMCIRGKIKFDIFDMPSFYRVCVYVISLLLSVFVMTNPTFFVQDFGIMMSGVLFFFLGYVLFTWEMGNSLLLAWSRLLIVPSIIVLLIFFNKSLGTEIISLLFQRYENFVFLQDLGRGRIFSIIDFEYLIPCVAIFLAGIEIRKKRFSRLEFYLITSLSFVSILLINYRYRFLTYALGLVLVSVFTKKFAPTIRKTALKTIVVLGVIYLSLSLLFFRSTILDRFLVRDYAEDQVSIERRLVMYQQAWDLFLQRPILGVGMGNYKDNVEIVYSRYGGRTYEPYYKILQNVYAYPHNWFLNVLAEDGVVGFVVLMWLLYMFLKMDIQLYKILQDDKLIIFVALSSVAWLFVFANLFTMMHVSLGVVIIFWACRGMIERMYKDAHIMSPAVVQKEERKKIR